MRDGKEDETITKNDQMRIHLGANSRPISFEYYTDIGTEQQASETYYYHYDLHGNVIRVTDDTGTTQITYTYDSLGTILTETNPNSIYNPFTWSGEAQIIHDPEFNTSAASPKTGLYSSGSGYYNPETGTFLSGTGMPASVNPTSGTMEEPAAQETKPANQLGGHAALAAVAGGVPVSIGPAVSVDVEPAAATTNAPPMPVIMTTGDIELSYFVIYGFDSSAEQIRATDTGDTYEKRVKENREAFKRMREAEKRAEEARKQKEDVKDGGDDYRNDPNWKAWNADNCVGNMIWRYQDLPVEVKALLRAEYRRLHPETKDLDDKAIDDNLELELRWVLWAGEGENTMLVGYQLKGHNPIFFWGPRAVHEEEGMRPYDIFDPTLTFTTEEEDEYNRKVTKTWKPGGR